MDSSSSDIDFSSSESSSSSSDDEDDSDDYSVDGKGRSRIGTRNFARQRMHWKRRLNSLTAWEFKRTYRQSTERFHSIVSDLKARQSKDWELNAMRGASKNAVSMELRWSMASRFLAGGSYLDIYQMHGVSRSTFFSLLWKTLDLFVRSYPTPWKMSDENECKKNAAAFQNRSSVPGTFSGCVGAIDGIGIKILAPRDKVNPGAYYSRKNYYSINCQAVCDASRRFLYWHSRAPGRSNDYAAIAFTKLGAELMTTLEQPEPAVPPIYPGFYLHGDLAYGCTRFILCPFKGKQPDQLKGRVVDCFNAACSMPPVASLLNKNARSPRSNGSHPTREKIVTRLSRDLGVRRPNARN